MDKIYIIDCDNQQIGIQLERLCFLADIQPPELPSQVAEFLKLQFGLLPYEVLKNAFDFWMSGKMTDIRKPQRINVHFVSLILREYINTYRHLIKMKQPIMIATPKPELTPEQKLESDKKSYQLCFEDFKQAQNGGIRLIPYIMHLIGLRGIKNFNYIVTPSDETEAIIWLENYEKRRNKEIEQNQQGYKTIKKIAPVLNTPIPRERLHSIAVCYTHFKKLLEGNEKAWY